MDITEYGVSLEPENSVRLSQVRWDFVSALIAKVRGRVGHFILFLLMTLTKIMSSSKR
jgi:hypothetical protein